MIFAAKWAKPDGVWARSQPLILRGEQSGLLSLLAMILASEPKQYRAIAYMKIR